MIWTRAGGSLKAALNALANRTPRPGHPAAEKRDNERFSIRMATPTIPSSVKYRDGVDDEHLECGCAHAQLPHAREGENEIDRMEFAHHDDVRGGEMGFLCSWEKEGRVAVDNFLIKTHLSTLNADFNQISSVLAKCRQNIHGLRDPPEELIPLFLDKIVQLTV